MINTPAVLELPEGKGERDDAVVMEARRAAVYDISVFGDLISEFFEFCYELNFVRECDDPFVYTE